MVSTVLTIGAYGPTNDVSTKCYFPFIHNGEAQFMCITDDGDDYAWCATSKDYGVDQQKGNCKSPSEQNKFFMYTL